MYDVEKNMAITVAAVKKKNQKNCIVSHLTCTYKVFHSGKQLWVDFPVLACPLTNRL